MSIFLRVCVRVCVRVSVRVRARMNVCICINVHKALSTKETYKRDLQNVNRYSREALLKLPFV